MHPRSAAALCAGVLSLTTIGAPAAMAAAKHRVTLRVIGRNGHASSAAHVQVEQLDGDGGSQPDPHRPFRLPRGTFAITAEIENGDDTTIGVQVVKVTGDRTVTFDARKGRPLRFAVDGAVPQDGYAQAMPLINGDQALLSYDGAREIGSMFVIPMRDRRVSLIAAATLSRDDGTDRYDLVHVVKGGLPEHPAFTDRRSTLTRVDMNFRRLDEGQSGALDLEASVGGATLDVAGTELKALPDRTVSYRSPGVAWQAIVSLSGPQGEQQLTEPSARASRAGHRTETWGAGSWGANTDGIDSSLDETGLTFMPREPFCPPEHGLVLRCTLTTSVRSRLYRSGKLLKETRGDLHYKIPKQTDWYTLTLDATRPAGTRLSTRLAGSWRFPAARPGGGAGSAPLLMIEYAPRALNSRNEAARGSVTTVPVYVDNAGHKSAIRTLTVEASTDGGHTWRRLPARRDGGHWTVQIRNPNAPGTVSLRATAKDARGDSTTQTLTAAYAVA
ncbi:hypothetical protein [Actinomadura gamaensis]|uniref:Serine protease n=1 Tax=Actinomadura gamaensis TaxID=1763541 RepID=A0ABV9UEK2_9ACTN